MNNEKKILALFGLKWNPFLPNIPVDALWQTPGMESFLFRLENMVMDGGFALIHGEPGLGKSKTLQYIAHRFKQMSELVRPGKVAYFSGCEARPGRVSHPLGSESLDRRG
jgi:hypothetical protein